MLVLGSCWILLPVWNVAEVRGRDESLPETSLSVARRLGLSGP